MRGLGYGDRWIQWMRFVHNQDIRILIVSRNHYERSKNWLQTKSSSTKITPSLNISSLKLFLMPVANGALNLYSKCEQKLGAFREKEHLILSASAPALQSRHYDIVIQDDLVGRAAFESDTTMQKTIEYHQLLVGAFDAAIDDGGRDNDEIIVGNRWSYKDLNSYIRTNEQYFNFTTHSALGAVAIVIYIPSELQIFPEAFNLEKLARYKKRLGSYLFSCQYLNVPINPAEVKFKLADLRGVMSLLEIRRLLLLILLCLTTLLLEFALR